MLQRISDITNHVFQNGQAPCFPVQLECNVAATKPQKRLSSSRLRLKAAPFEFFSQENKVFRKLFFELAIEGLPPEKSPDASCYTE
jgi:hypothetical protein